MAHSKDCPSVSCSVSAHFSVIGMVVDALRSVFVKNGPLELLLHAQNPGKQSRGTALSRHWGFLEFIGFPNCD